MVKSRVIVGGKAAWKLLRRTIMHWPLGPGTFVPVCTTIPAALPSSVSKVQCATIAFAFSSSVSKVGCATVAFAFSSSVSKVECATTAFAFSSSVSEVERATVELSPPNLPSRPNMLSSQPNKKRGANTDTAAQRIVNFFLNPMASHTQALSP